MHYNQTQFLIFSAIQYLVVPLLLQLSHCRNMLHHRRIGIVVAAVTSHCHGIGCHCRLPRRGCNCYIVGCTIWNTDSIISLCCVGWSTRTSLCIIVHFAGLGPTVSELDVSQCPVFPKTSFSMLIPAVEEHMKKLEGNYFRMHYHFIYRLGLWYYLFANINEVVGHFFFIQTWQISLYNFFTKLPAR